MRACCVLRHCISIDLAIGFEVRFTSYRYILLRSRILRTFLLFSKLYVTMKISTHLFTQKFHRQTGIQFLDGCKLYQVKSESSLQIKLLLQREEDTKERRVI